MAKYIELNILPNLLAFAFAKAYNDNLLMEESYESYYNSIKSLINIVDENKKLIYIITNQILANKYKLTIINKNPLRIKRIN